MPEPNDTQATEGQPTVRLPRVVVDFKIPLPWLLGGAVAVLWGLITMYFQLMNLTASVEEMKATVKANNNSTLQFASELALAKFRIEKLEGEMRGAGK
ncbi:MAG TPA: hypothetical protein VGE22_12375 [Solimonas sp.]